MSAGRSRVQVGSLPSNYIESDYIWQETPSQAGQNITISLFRTQPQGVEYVVSIKYTVSQKDTGLICKGVTVKQLAFREKGTSRGTTPRLAIIN